ncbi:hypothetical protein ABEB36_000651 [Hypothenemus hampei]|uniref:Uncharacterized protein n=1 Tax=Hypothenemus hampei TaxID=57062 RepID=A0ABD1FBY6_HYPHA
MPDHHHKDNGATKNGTNMDTIKSELESSEIDPCIESKPKVSMRFHEKVLADLQERTQLNRHQIIIGLAVVSLAVALLIVVIGLSIAWPRLPHMLGYPLCKTSQCLRAASQLQDNINASISPCNDLWGSICTKYAKTPMLRPPNKPVWNLKQLIIQKELERIRTEISTLELPVHIGTVEWKLKHFYEACLDVDTIALDRERPLTNIISELGGWYILRDWNDVDFDGMKVLNNLHVRYGVSPYFRVHVEPNPHVANSYSIRISPSGLGLPDRAYYYLENDDRIIVSYMDYIRDVVISLSSTKNEAGKFAKDIFNYEKRLAEINPERVQLQNPIKTYNAISLSELKQTTSTQIPFYDILQAMFPDVTITENSEVIVTDLEYLSQVAQIISSTDRHTMNGYLIWCLVRQYLPYLSENYTAALHSFNNELFGVSKREKRWETCTKLVRKHMALAIEARLETVYPISEKTGKILNDTFVTILRVVKEKVGKFDNSVLLTQHLESKLKSLTFHLGLPQSTRTSQFIKDHYNALKIVRMNLFEGIKSILTLQRRIEEKLLQNTMPEGVFLKELFHEEPQVRYLPSKNTIVVPRSLLVDPYFEVGYPRPVLYGRLGVEIAEAILSAILPYDSLWTSNRKILSPFHMTVNESLNSMRESVECLMHKKINKEAALLALKHLLAVRVAYESMNVASSMEGHMHFGGLERYEEDEVYFITHAQTQCAQQSKQYEFLENVLYFRVSSKSMLDLTWRNIKEFPEAFSCSVANRKSCV